MILYQPYLVQQHSDKHNGDRDPEDRDERFASTILA